MQDEQQDILYRAAEVWKELTAYRYIFTYGYKEKLHHINLTFSPEDFPHLAGFQYLKDLTLPRYSPRKTVDMILAGKITDDQVKKGQQYSERVKPRLRALVRLKERLDQEFELFSYRPMFYSFFTKIKADYLISSNIEPSAFVFIIKGASNSTVSEFLCCSAFEKGDRDYCTNQRPYDLLRKARVHIETGNTEVLYNRLIEKKSSPDESAETKDEIGIISAMDEA